MKLLIPLNRLAAVAMLVMFALIATGCVPQQNPSAGKPVKPDSNAAKKTQPAKPAQEPAKPAAEKSPAKPAEKPAASKEEKTSPVGDSTVVPSSSAYAGPTLSSSQTYTGPTTLSGGTQQVTIGSAHYGSGLTVTGGTLQMSAPLGIDKPNGGSSVYSGPMTIKPGILTLTGSNTFSGGTTISGGTATKPILAPTMIPANSSMVAPNPGDPDTLTLSTSGVFSLAKDAPGTEKQAVADRGNGGTPPSDDQPAEKKPKDLGPPLVDKPDALKKLDRESPVWLDVANKQVVLVGETSAPSYPLEFFATLPDRGYEAVVTITTKPHVVHAALLALGAKTGHPAKFEPKFVPPSGMEIAIEVVWKDKDGKRQQCPAQDWIRNIQTKKTLDKNWVFAGSGFQKNEDTGKEYYLADGGDFIAVLNLPTAMLDVPFQSASAIESRSFEGNPEKMPAAGTPVTVLIRPKLEAEKKK